MAHTGRLVTSTATVTATALTLAAAVWALWRAQVAVTITVVAVLAAVALDRPVKWMERHGLPRAAGIAAVALAVVLGIAALVLLFVPPAVDQLRQLAESGPELLRRAEESDGFRFLARHVDVDAAVRRLRARAPALIGDLLGPAVAVFTRIAGAIAGLVTLLFVVVLMLASGRQLVGAALVRAHPDRRAIYAQLLTQLYHSLGGYIGGLFAIILSNMVFSGIFLAAIGVPYFLPLAVLAGISSLIPYAGAIIAGAALSGVAWASGGAWLGFATLGYYVAYEQLESHLIAPLVYRRTLDLNPLVILLVVLFMTDLSGIPGALVAIPLVVTAQIVMREVLRLRRERPCPPTVPSSPELLDPARAGERSGNQRLGEDRISH